MLALWIRDLANSRPRRKPQVWFHGRGSPTVVLVNWPGKGALEFLLQKQRILKIATSETTVMQIDGNKNHLYYYLPEVSADS